ncbi:MAG: hypothetical protein R2911_39215 [Caldilineaceae bacterium]
MRSYTAEQYLLSPLTPGDSAALYTYPTGAGRNQLEIAQRCTGLARLSWQQRFPAFKRGHGRNEFAELYERCHIQLARNIPI